MKRDISTLRINLEIGLDVVANTNELIRHTHSSAADTEFLIMN